MADRSPLDPPAEARIDLDPYRLPRSVAPRRYDVRLAPDLDAARFDGEVEIALEVVEPTRLVVLNAADLELHEVSIDGRRVEPRLDAANERLLLHLDTPLEPGAATLRASFTGVLNDLLRGWYRSTYRDADGGERVIAASQAQATDCRRIFPCWDEPDRKAVFAITLDVPDDLVAVSNGAEVERTALPGGRVRVRFSDTLPMSSYLVAMIVGPLEITPPVDVDGIPVRTVHVPGKGHLTGLGLDVAAYCLRWFQDYYGIPYPSDKVDLVAVPDFAAGAMENLGCITFRESLLLVDPATSTQVERQQVADVVAHELAHMWFGDLVTMRWWNGIWLNEAFATFMEIAACDAYRPDWERWVSFGQERTAAFETDALTTTRSIEYEVRSPNDCEGMFDVLTYQKGGALLRMLEQYLGPDPFRRGVAHYLATHALGNTETSDLWDALEEITGEPVRRLMDSWIWQQGFPVARARLRAAPTGHELVLDQERFLYPTPSHDGAASTGPATDATRWVVPVHVRVGEREHKVLLDDLEVVVPLADLDDGTPVLVNAGGVGFFRVAYDDELRGRLGEALDTLSPLERYCLVDDAWSAVVADRLEASRFLELVGGFGDEDDVAVWRSIAAGLRGCARLLPREGLDQLAGLTRSLAGPALDRLGWEPSPADTDLTHQLRALLVSLVAILGDDGEAQLRCATLVDQSFRDPTSVQADLAAAAVTVHATTGGVEAFERFLAAFRAADNPQEQLRFLYALAEPRERELIERASELAFSGEVRTQNAPFLLNRCLANRWAGDAAWRVVRRRWQEANERFPSNSIIRMVDAVKWLDDPAVAADVQAFFSEHEIPQAATTLRQVLERQRVNVTLRAREAERLMHALTVQMH